MDKDLTISCKQCGSKSCGQIYVSGGYLCGDCILAAIAERDKLQARVEELKSALSMARSDIWQTARANQGNINGMDPVFPEDPPCEGRIGNHFVHQRGVDQSLKTISEIDTLLAKG